MFQKIKRSPMMLGLSAAAAVTIAILAACGQAALDPSLAVDGADKGKLNASKANQPKTKSRIVQPTGKAFNGRVESLLGNKRIKGKIASMQDSELSTKVSDYSFDIGTDTNGNGGADEHVESQLEIAGLGKNKIVIVQDNYPVMSNQLDVVTIKDETSGNVRTYKADQDLFNYSASDGGSELSVKSLPDGTWTVNGVAAATPEAAAELAMKSPIIADASVHSLMLMYQIFKHTDLVPVEYIEETMMSGGSGSSLKESVSFGDPKPLLKEVIKLKLKLKKPGK